MKKATLTFVSMFFWMFVQYQLSPTKADNVLTWAKAVMVAELEEGLEINFNKLILVVIHEREFKTSTTYPFPCLIFELCRDVWIDTFIDFIDRRG